MKSNIFKKLGLICVLALMLVSCGNKRQSKKDALLEALTEQYRPDDLFQSDLEGFYLNNDTLVLVYELRTKKIVGLDTVNLNILR